MKLFLPTGAIIIYLAGSVLRAQDAPLPKAEAQDPAEPAPPPSTPAPQLIPPELLAPSKLPPPDPSLPSIPQLDEGFKPPPLSPTAENQRKHVEWRQLRNQVQNDRDVKAALKTAEAARTDLEKRKLLGRYYELFYGKIIARAAPEMKEYLAARKADALRALPQPRVRPGVSMSNSTSDSPSSSSASPSPYPSIAPSPSPILPSSVVDPLPSPVEIDQ